MKIRPFIILTFPNTFLSFSPQPAARNPQLVFFKRAPRRGLDKNVGKNYHIL